ncbi:MAG TPA: DUF3040 domain-containing protein [Streptosporangiaceae bacterium]|nr:DUF3040 domain-containing protein [Streptosporangiaceae bacterium]
MPLSEHEQRQLEQIEQALYADYPKLAQAVRARDPRVHYKRRVVQAVFLFLLGVGLLLAGVVSKLYYISVAGFVVMLFSAMWGLNSWRHMGGVTSGRGFGAGRGPVRATDKRRRRRRDSGFMERLEERWRRRQEGGR